MSMNLGLLPEEYPNIYMKDMGRWVDMRYYEMEGEKVPAELWDMDKIDLWDEEYLILFATPRRLGDYDMYKKEGIVALEVGTYNNDIFIYNMEFIASTDNTPEFSLYGRSNFIGKFLEDDTMCRKYQIYHRFFIGTRNYMSTIKMNIIDIVYGKWSKNDNISSF
tara:strand:- start:1084 stop:1575 length:492 start_codon:yes stop_codon:yes gene_type:complete